MTTFTPVSDSGSAAGRATNIVLSDHGFFTLTAVKTFGGDLKLIGWRTGDTVSRLVDSDNQAGAVSEIALGDARGHTITAVRDGSGNLKLISWDVDIARDKIIRLADSGDQGDDARGIAATGVTGFFLVTAHRTGANRLKLISWGVGLNGAITRLGDSGDQPDVVDAIALVELPGSRCLTAVREGGNLKLISWEISQDGRTITRLADSGNQGGPVSAIAPMCPSTDLRPVNPLIEVTAVRDSGGNLKLISWEISQDGRTITRKADSANLAGAIRIAAIDRFRKSTSAIPTHPSGYLTAVVTGGLRLKLIAFAVDSSGAVTRTGDSGDRDQIVTEVALAAREANTVSGPVTAIRDGLGIGNQGPGNLKVINWRMRD